MSSPRWMALGFAACLAACGGSSNSTADAGTDAGSDAGTDAGIDAGSVQRGPITLEFTGDPEGLWWDSARSILYIADQENNQILTWTDAAGFAVFSALPGGAQDAEDLGQVVLTPQGNLLVTIFGFGTAGAINVVAPDGGASAVTGLDVTFRRLGLGQASDGTLYESYFTKASSAANPIGSIATVALTEQSDGGWSGSETPVVTGLGKPVGVLAVNGNLYITDQETNDFITTSIAALPNGTPTVVASNLAVDLLSVGPNGTFFTGSSTGALNQLTTAGVETPFVSGYANPRGSAYDSVNNRVFFGNHVQTGGMNQLVIVPGP